MSNNHAEMNESQEEENNGLIPNKIEITAVVDGEVVPIDLVDDQIFSQKLIGDGYGIHPIGKTIYSPVDGVIEQIAATKHAVYLAFNDELKLLIHIGIDTIELKGEGFESNLKKGMPVKKGTPLIQFDPKLIADEGFNPVVTVILLNSTERAYNIKVYPTEAAIGNQTIAMDIEGE